ncbi:MAG: biotin--[acetyl-CoA-carboxylase] ligase [Zetaproteobacteria bacterium]|nr:MAG: biotin--[acetyl-CoA-carboxylase] ligase [Zetaproteobacteria bacterium]
MKIDWKIQTYDRILSTQDRLKNDILGNPALPEGTVIHAHHQDGGHGRYGRVWQSDAENLTLSFLIRPKCSIDKIGQVAILTGLAISNVIDQVIDTSCKSLLKWPNDILIKDKKCCGILIDASPLIDGKVPYLIIGIGVNIASSPLDTSTCLQDHTKDTVHCDDFMKELLSSFSICYMQWQNDGFELIRSQWLAKTYKAGCPVGVKLDMDQVQGTFDTIDMLGNLVITCGKTGEKRKITSGEVFLL